MRYFWYLYLTVSMFLILSEPAHAYIDPSSGSYFLQFIIAGLLGAAFAFKSYVKRAVTFVNHLFKSKKESSGESGSFTS